MVNIILLVVALVCFVLSALGASVPRLNLLALGLSFWIVALLLNALAGRT